jgi:hypothetical protein
MNMPGCDVLYSADADVIATKPGAAPTQITRFGVASGGQLCNQVVDQAATCAP